MTNNQRSFYSKKDWIFEKYVTLTQDIVSSQKDRMVDNCEGLWNVSKHTLDYYWYQYFSDYGTCLQDTFTKNQGTKMPYHEYLRNAIISFISNNFYGLVKVESCNEDEAWTISAAVPPTTVLNCLRYTPHTLENNDVTAEYIIYQIISAVEELHLSNIPHLGLTLDNLYIDENFVLKLSLPNMNALSERVKHYSLENEETDEQLKEDESLDLRYVLWNWMVGKISNLDYLLYLNKLAGRTETDPNNHFMIPWVTDFTVLYGGLRDLKLSKFRINKGDDHLNKIYQDQLEEFEHFTNDCPLDNGINRNSCVAPEASSKTLLNVKTRINKSKTSVAEFSHQRVDYKPSYPHHVSDILSELSYYAYMARVTPIDILKKSYRSFYNPQEFRWNMSKMYDWTPDECIPQFYTDPSVFRSMHPDMPDIELPEWCQNPEEFVKYHREILEGQEVSSELHHWIDLVFGYKLIGEEAVKAKNVHRQFADRSSKMTNNGLTVLFRVPHPRRLCSYGNIRKYFGSQRPQFQSEEIQNNQSNESIISLPDDYDAAELLDYYKIFNSFIQDSCNGEALELKEGKRLQKCLLEETFEEDIISICCLIIEIFNFDKIPADYLYSAKNLRYRIECCSLLMYEDLSRIPLNFRDSVEKVINQCRGKSVRIPDIIELKSCTRWFRFSRSTIRVFDVIKSINSSHIDSVVAMKQFFSNQIINCKFNVQTLLFLTPHFVSLLKPSPSMEFDKVLDALICITQKFGLFIGKTYFINEILPHIVCLYPNDRDQVKSQHALLYQRTFLNLLFVRIGMVEFLNNITELLVQMLVIGQHIFGSLKESCIPEIDLKFISNDTESLNDYESSSFWYVHIGDDDVVGRDNRASVISSNSDGESMKTDIILDPDSVSQSSVDMEELKSNPTKPNGYTLVNPTNILDNLPLSDSDLIDDNVQQLKNKNGGLTQLLSPFRKISSKQKANQFKSSKIQLRNNLSQDCTKMSLAHLSCSSLIWLADLIGPIQASSKILCELLAQFLLCYQNFHFDEPPFGLLDESKASLVTGTYDSCIQADLETSLIFECLREFIALYGLAVVDRQFRHFLDTLLDKSKFFMDDFGSDMETNLVCSLSLLRFLGMVIPDDYLESFLSEKILDDYLPLIIKCISNMAHPFPSGVKARKVLFHKTIDLIYLLSSRMKYDQIQSSMGNVFKLLFGLFNKTFVTNENDEVIYRSVSFDVLLTKTVTDSSQYIINFSQDENDFTIHSDLPTLCDPPNSGSPLMLERKYAFEEMKIVLTIELAYVLYITFAKLLGQNRLKSLLYNHSLIQTLVVQHENDLNKSNLYSSPDKAKQQKLEETLKVCTSSVIAHKTRHLNDLWNQYWVHELGFCDSESFDIKQMCLGKFEGHANAVKGFDVLNCENGFLSYGKDRTVKLFSCADIDYCNVSNEVVSRFSYTHQKAVTHAMFMEQMRMAISVDCLLHLWDPFVGKKILDTSLGVKIPNWSMVCCVPPVHFLVAVANADGRVQIVDLRSGCSTYSYNLNINSVSGPSYGDFATSMGVPGGFIKQIAGSPDGNQLIIGNSEGFVSLVDLRMCRLLQTWRPHQNEITQIQFMRNWCVTSSMEPNGKLHLFSLSNFSRNQSTYGTDLGSIHSMMMLRNQILVGASQNRFGLFTSANQYKSLNRLSPTLYKGTVTTASLLLHNKLLLLGNDTGNISLWY